MNQPKPIHRPLPQDRAFVVQMHAGKVTSGRAEHIATGEFVVFQTLDELNAFIDAHQKKIKRS